MMIAIGLGALLFFCGLLYMAYEAISQRRLSGPVETPRGIDRGTLEPPRQGMRFLGVGMNWPGIGLMAFGVILMVAGTFA
jgi:hypothetical protein